MAAEQELKVKIMNKLSRKKSDAFYVTSSAPTNLFAAITNVGWQKKKYIDNSYGFFRDRIYLDLAEPAFHLYLTNAW